MIRNLKILLLLFIGCNILAQPNVRFEEAKSLNDLSQNTVVSIYQDKKGFLWLGTFNGLNKYDGYSFKTYMVNKAENNSGLNRINDIQGDTNGRLWIETYDGKIYRFNPETEKFIGFPLLDTLSKRNTITNFHLAKNGVVWLSTNKAGIYCIKEAGDQDSLLINHITNRNNAGFISDSVNFVITDNEGDCWIGSKLGLNRIKKDDFFVKHPHIVQFYGSEGNNSQVAFTTGTSIGNISVFGSYNKGVFIYNSLNNQFNKVNAEGKINVIESNNKNIWIGTSKGKVYQLDETGSLTNIYALNTNLTGNSIEKIHFDGYGNPWILTDGFGISMISTVTNQVKYYELTPLNKREITDNERTIFFLDKDENIWLGVVNMGIALYMPEQDKFHFYSNDPNDPSTISSDVIGSIYQDRDGVMWVGTSWFGSGLNKMLKIDPAFKYIQPVKKPKSKTQNIVRSVYEDQYGNTWIGTKNGKIYIYNKGYKLIHTIEKNKQINYSGHNVYSIYEDSKGFIWLCTKGSGIVRSNTPLKSVFPDYSKLKFTHFRNDPKNNNTLSNNNVYDITEDQWGRYWIATYGGGLNLLTFDGTTANFKKINTSNSSISSDKIRDLLIDQNNRLWIATTYGLNYKDLSSSNLNKEERNSFEFVKDISYKDVLMIIEDADNNIWTSTAGGGINKIVVKENKILNIKTYTRSEGLKDNLTYSLVNDFGGNIWIGTKAGLSRYIVDEDKFENIDEQNGLPVLLFSERTNISNSRHELIFGTINGFYVVNPKEVKTAPYTPNICLTKFLLFNREVLPQQKESPLKKAISHTNEIILKHNQSVFSFEFSALSYISSANNQFAYKLEGFENKWNKVGANNKATYTNIPPGKYLFIVKSANGDKILDNTGTSCQIIIKPPIWLSKLAYIIYFIVFVLLTYIAIKIGLRFAKLKSNMVVERKVAESKLRFFTNISHEIRTPLTLILGPIENLIESSSLAPEDKRQLNVIRKNSQRLLRMVNQLLDFRKVQNEKMKLHVKEINLVRLVKNVYENFEDYARQKHLDFKLNIGQEKITIFGDLQQMDIILFNLLSNAFKFTPNNGSISLNIDLNDEKEYVEIKVIDTGIGISEEKLPYVFNRFFVSHTGTNDKSPGTGIGLSLVNEYITLHKGTINVESKPGQGTTFSIILKAGYKHLVDVLPEKHTFSNINTIENNESTKNTYNQLNDENIKTPKGEAPLVLIVEDDTDMIEYIGNSISSTYRILKAQNGKEGLVIAIKHLPDLIISDVMMPEMDGFELVQQLKGNFNTSHIPIIMLTAKTDINDQVEGFSSGAEAYIQKPFNKPILLSNISSLLSQRKILEQKFDNIVELKPDEIKIESKDKVFIEQVLEIINANLEDTSFNVEKLVEQMNVSRTLFYKKVTSLTGQKPVELIRQIRLKRAYKIIESGEYNISEAAYMVGFNDIRYFSTCFKKEFGVNPSKVIKK